MAPKEKFIYPPIPMVNALSSQFLPSIMGISRPAKLPGPSRISCVWPWSTAAPPCACDAPSCEWLCDMLIEHTITSKTRSVGLIERVLVGLD
jgi:hypothetical protein